MASAGPWVPAAKPMQAQMLAPPAQMMRPQMLFPPAPRDTSSNPPPQQPSHPPLQEAMATAAPLQFAAAPLQFALEEISQGIASDMGPEFWELMREEGAPSAFSSLTLLPSSPAEEPSKPP